MTNIHEGHAMNKVSSTNVGAFGYNKEAKTLIIEFKNGNTYKYSNVDIKTYQLLLTAPSKGKAVSKYIVGKFTHEKLK